MSDADSYLYDTNPDDDDNPSFDNNLTFNITTDPETEDVPTELASGDDCTADDAILDSRSRVPRALHGGYERDLARGFHRFESEEQWLAWKEQEEKEKCIEFIYSSPRRPSPKSQWLTQVIYRCSRAYSGGKKQCTAHDTEGTASKKRPNRRIGTKKTGCKALIKVKTYPGRSEYLIEYRPDHSHGLGSENIRYCRLPSHVRNKIEQYLKDGLSAKDILEKCRETFSHEEHQGPNPAADRSILVTRSAVRHIQRKLEAGKTCIPHKKRKADEYEPYSGGEKPSKKAKKDALEPLKPDESLPLNLSEGDALCLGSEQAARSTETRAPLQPSQGSTTSEFHEIHQKLLDDPDSVEVNILARMTLATLKKLEQTYGLKRYRWGNHGAAEEILNAAKKGR